MTWERTFVFKHTQAISMIPTNKFMSGLKSKITFKPTNIPGIEYFIQRKNIFLSISLRLGEICSKLTIKDNGNNKVSV